MARNQSEDCSGHLPVSVQVVSLCFKSFNRGTGLVDSR
jgi:hypothetical protein